MTTQQSGFMGPGGAESSQVLVKSLVKVAFRGELDCSGLLGRTPLRRFRQENGLLGKNYCSGLLGRTPLRQVFRAQDGFGHHEAYS